MINQKFEELSNKIKCRECDLRKGKKKVTFKNPIATEQSISFEHNNHEAYNATKTLDLTIPDRMVKKFIEAAKNNSNKLTPIETGGILAGITTEKITELIIPKQIGKPDAWIIDEEKENETEGFFDYMNDNNLKICGTIHTHPKFECFLSSVDLHNHFLVQKTNPNAIAIVYSDMFNEAKIFHLTELGMNTIQKCTRHPSEHHSHEIDASKLYTSVALDLKYIEGYGQFTDLREKDKSNEPDETLQEDKSRTTTKNTANTGIVENVILANTIEQAERTTTYPNPTNHAFDKRKDTTLYKNQKHTPKSKLRESTYNIQEQKGRKSSQQPKQNFQRQLPKQPLKFKESKNTNNKSYIFFNKYDKKNYIRNQDFQYINNRVSIETMENSTSNKNDILPFTNDIKIPPFRT